MKAYLIGISGGSGSGKTTLTRMLCQHFGTSQCQIVSQDNYYIDQSDKFDFDGGCINFDHPSSIDFDLMVKHLQQLKNGQSIEVPLYDFATHKRLQKGELLTSRRLIFVDGILLYCHEALKDLFDFKIFLQVQEDLRFSRRLKRDTEERGRTPEGVREQFYKQVKPMHDQFVEPCAFDVEALLNDKQFESQFQKLVRDLTHFLA